MGNSQKYNDQNRCRICCQMSNDQSIDLLKTDPRLITHVYDYFGVQVTSNDKKTTMLCANCQQKIIMWLNDKHNAARAQVVVRKWIDQCKQ